MLLHVMCIFPLFLHVSLILFVIPFIFMFLITFCTYILRHYLWDLFLDKCNKIFKILLLFTLRFYNIFYLIFLGIISVLHVINYLFYFYMLIQSIF